MPDTTVKEDVGTYSSARQDCSQWQTYAGLEALELPTDQAIDGAKDA